MTAVAERIAGAPITWGVCEVPSWGVQLSPRRVLEEMADIGLRATELGPEGFLPTDPADLRGALSNHGLTLAGGFVPAVLHDTAVLDAELSRVERQAELLAAAGASALVLAASGGSTDYESSLGLDESAWDTLVGGLDAVMEVARSHRLVAALHPHYGTVIEGPADVDRLLERSTVPLCLDTGHLAVGGADPVAVASKAARRVAHVHLKDVSTDLSERVRDGRLGYHEAVRLGMYRPLGQGDLEIAAVVSALEAANYGGWYVLEQDTVLDSEAPDGRGPVDDARASHRFLLGIADRIEGHGSVNERQRDGVRAGKEGA